MKKQLFSVSYMFLITLCFTSMVSAVKYFNDERIQLNEKVKFQKIVLKVLGIYTPEKASDRDVVETFDKQVKEINIEGEKIYIGYEPDRGDIKGYAFPVNGPGFWGPIYGMAAVDKNGERLVGLAFYRHSETPGLGGRITENWFQKQFEGLNINREDKKGEIFRLTPAGTGKGPHELDAITGATMTSRSVEKFLNEELKRFKEEIKGQLIRSRSG